MAKPAQTDAEALPPVPASVLGDDIHTQKLSRESYRAERLRFARESYAKRLEFCGQLQATVVTHGVDSEACWREIGRLIAIYFDALSGNPGSAAVINMLRQASDQVTKQKLLGKEGRPDDELAALRGLMREVTAEEL